MTESHVCSTCGDSRPATDMTSFDEQELCPRCLEEDTTICARCGERIWRDNNAGNESFPLCQNCYDHHYTSCNHCGTILLWDDACYASEDEDEEEPLCHSCSQRRRASQSIQEYYYKPEPIFYGTGPRFFGVELEIDEAGENSAHADSILGIANLGEELAYCKHDGSLDDGFEIVTHPMTLEYHMSQMPWPAILERAVELGYRSHKARTCGLHVHVNRDTFGSTEEEQDAAIARVLYFVERHWDELLKFSRRTEYQLKRWAARYGYKEQPRDILDHAKKGYGGGRYSSVNLQNADTIEFRIFRGTLKLNTLLATLQLVNKVCDVAIFMSDDEVKALSWTSFVESIGSGDCPELVQYLKERRLYINEPMDVEEDD